MANTRNLWPLGITVTLIVFVAGTATLIVIACSHRTELVTDDYYAQEVRFQRQIDREVRTRLVKSQISVAYDPARQCITVELPKSHVQPGTKGQIELYRPSASGQDRREDLKINARGLQTLDAKGLSSGLWKVRITWTAGGEEFFFDQKVVIGNPKT